MFLKSWQCVCPRALYRNYGDVRVVRFLQVMQTENRVIVPWLNAIVFIF